MHIAVPVCIDIVGSVAAAVDRAWLLIWLWLVDGVWLRARLWAVDRDWLLLLLYMFRWLAFRCPAR